MIRLPQYAKLLNIKYQTAHRHWRKGIVKGIQLKTGTILVNPPFEENKPVIENNNEIRVALYSRVSSSENKPNLDRQLERIRDYSIAKGYKITEEVKEIGSGINANRRKLLALLKKDTYDIIVVEHKDRFSRFGIEIIEELLLQTEKKIEIINNIQIIEEDIVQDLISIITSFSAKIYGQRRSKRKTVKIINSLNKFNNAEGAKEENKIGEGKRNKTRK